MCVNKHKLVVKLTRISQLQDRECVISHVTDHVEETSTFGGETTLLEPTNFSNKSFKLDEFTMNTG